MYKVNPHERLYILGDDGYHECHLEYKNDYDISQDDDPPTIFSIDTNTTLDSLVRGHDDITLLEKKKLERKKGKV